MTTSTRARVASMDLAATAARSESGALSALMVKGIRSMDVAVQGRPGRHVVELRHRQEVVGRADVQIASKGDDAVTSISVDTPLMEVDVYVDGRHRFTVRADSQAQAA